VRAHLASSVQCAQCAAGVTRAACATQTRYWRRRRVLELRTRENNNNVAAAAATAKRSRRVLRRWPANTSSFSRAQTTLQHDSTTTFRPRTCPAKVARQITCVDLERKAANSASRLLKQQRVSHRNNEHGNSYSINASHRFTSDESPAAIERSIPVTSAAVASRNGPSRILAADVVNGCIALRRATRTIIPL
jgi:hypothetical protein